MYNREFPWNGADGKQIGEILEISDSEAGLHARVT